MPIDTGTGHEREYSAIDEPTPKRPIGVILIAWAGILYTLVTAVPKALVLIEPELYESVRQTTETLAEISLVPFPFELQLAHALLAVPVVLVSAIYMLKGRLWSLVIFVLWMFSAVLLTFLVTGFSLSAALKLVVALLVTAVLTRPRALRFFSPTTNTERSDR